MIQESEEVKEETIDKIFVFGNDIKTKSGQNISDLVLKNSKNYRKKLTLILLY